MHGKAEDESLPMKTALCIGIDYVGQPYELRGGTADSEAWAELLRGHDFRVERLEEEKATKAAVLDAIARTLEGAGRDGLAVVTYAGHGSFMADVDGDEPDCQDEAWLPWDFHDQRQYIRDDEIHDILRERGRERRIVFISDSCTNGTVTKVAAERSDPGSRFVTPLALVPEDKWNLIRKCAGLPVQRSDLALLFAATRDNEDARVTVDPNGVPRGRFSLTAIDVFRERAPESFIEWWSRVLARMDTKRFRQTPQLVGTSFQMAWRPFEEGPP
jgi:hypothetical protein